MKTVIFDLDDTLLSGDSEFKWAEYTVEKGLINKDFYMEKISEFEVAYRAGNMDFDAYCIFLLNPLIGKTTNEIESLVREFINQYEELLIDSLTYDLLEKHKNDKKIIASGSLNFIVEGFSRVFSIDTFFGTPLEIENNKITGNLDGVATFAEGKLITMQEWSKKNNFNLEDATFYTDSINDLPLVKVCKNSIIISPDEELEKYAKENSLEIIYR